MLGLTFGLTLGTKKKHLIIQGASLKASQSFVIKEGAIQLPKGLKTLGEITRAVESILPSAEALGASGFILDVPSFAQPKLVMPAMIRALFNLSYRYNRYKTDAQESFLKTLHVVAPKALQPSFNKEKALLTGIQLAKDLVNAPANGLFPDDLANEARALQKLSKKVKVEVLNYAKLQSMGFGAFCGVAQGSAAKGCLVLIHYKGASAKAPLHALVGKGITFDTGGISLKPGPGMETMNSDMGGAGSVVGTLRATIEADLKVNCLGVLACAENMPDGEAQRPSDIVTTYLGKTVEVLNTDAEGRLVLCDALAYVNKQYKPSSMVDIATLTGAQVVALGSINSALYSNHESLASKLEAASKNGLDPAWRMPLDPEYARMIQGNSADLANIGVRDSGAGSVTAAEFLHAFVGKTPWAHLDVAGPARTPKGASGRPVPLLFHYLCALEES